MRTFRFVCFLLIAFSPIAWAQLPELRDLDLTGWDCLSKLEGAARTQDGKERNVQKNRAAVDLAGVKVPSFDLSAFLARAAE